MDDPTTCLIGQTKLKTSGFHKEINPSLCPEYPSHSSVMVPTIRLYHCSNPIICRTANHIAMYPQWRDKGSPSQNSPGRSSLSVFDLISIEFRLNDHISLLSRVTLLPFRCHRKLRSATSRHLSSAFSMRSFSSSSASSHLHTHTPKNNRQQTTCADFSIGLSSCAIHISVDCFPRSK